MAAEQPKKVTGGAFGQFLAENRPKLQAECKGQPVTAVVKLASEKFKALDATEKKVYEDKYEKAKAQYATDMEAFLAAGGEKKAIKRKGDKLEKKGKKKMKDANAPKKPAGGAYGCYLDMHRAAIMKEVAGQPITAVSKLAGERWKALSAAEKKPFEEKYEVKKAAYEAAMKDYVPPPAEEGEEPVLSKKEQKAAAKEAAKAEKENEKKAKIEAKEAAKQEKANAKEAKKAMKGTSLKPTAKKPAAGAEKPSVELMPNVVAKAEKAGLTEVLLKLAARDDIKESGKTQLQMLSALESSGGLLHPARRALLGC